MRVVVVFLLATACGRVGFDSTRDGGGGGDGKTPDVPTSCVDDGFCVPGCGVTDPDCQTTCGDAVCVGNAGETCKTCTADCRTTNNVCGNHACGPGEDGNSCPYDCGPVPWTWVVDEEDLMARINTARTGGTSCGGGAPTTAPALTVDLALRASARDLAWEQAHIGLFFNRCDGQSMIAYVTSSNATNYKIASSSSVTTNAQRMAELIADTPSCQSLMSTSLTRFAVAIAVDQNNGYVVLFR